MRIGNYIEAYYDFYFVLETLYGSGKTKNSAIEKEFLSSKELMSAISAVKCDSELIKGIKATQREEFVEKYKDKPVDDIIRKLISLRGFLHHQNPKHPDAWTPDNQERCHLDSIFLMHVTYSVIWNVVDKYIYDDSVLESYSKQYTEHGYT